MNEAKRLYEGKAKIIYQAEEPDRVYMSFKDEATAFDGKKRGLIAGKGFFNAQISAALFQYLEGQGIPTHYLGRADERTLIVRRLAMLPVEVVVRNLAAGSISRRLGLEEGRPLHPPVLEFYYKSDALGDPLINEYHIRALELATPAQVAEMAALAERVNAALSPHLRERGLILVDFKLEFGLAEGRMVLGDEISPDTCRLWDASTQQPLDKDRFRRDLGEVEEAYAEVWRRVTGGESQWSGGPQSA
ncbi:MAG: phosphoribosylaminoimidazolesuccinocarboxamide synthase [Bacillota bacterium]|nr:phosphoribosylaminoimidazolesuccinocarboxamide synthase [Bacillota bacterium]